MTTGGDDDDDDGIWKRARASVAEAYSKITHDVFSACNDPDFTGDTPFGPSQHVYGEVSDTARICAVLDVGPLDVLCDLVGISRREEPPLPPPRLCFYAERERAVPLPPPPRPLPALFVSSSKSG